MNTPDTPPSPLYPKVYLDRLIRQLDVWEQQGISDTRALKLLRLWGGYKLTQYMDSQGRYTFHSFNLLRQQLGYKSLPLLLDDLVRSRSFVLLSCDIDASLLRQRYFLAPSRPHRELPHGITAFCSPLWHQWQESDGTPLEGSLPNCRKQALECDDILNNYNNIILSGGSAQAEEAGEAASGEGGALTLAEVEAAEQQEMKQAIALTRDYFRNLVHNEDAQQRQPMEYILWRLQQPEHPAPGQPKGYGLTAEEAHEVLATMIDHGLAPHFARDKNFNQPSRRARPEGRIYQVSAYVKRYSQPMLDQALKRWRKRQANRQRENQARELARMRDNRPLSPHEWTDPNGSRWWEDDKGGLHTIPPEAPPRPAADAQYNYITRQWTVPEEQPDTHQQPPKKDNT